MQVIILYRSLYSMRWLRNCQLIRTKIKKSRVSLLVQSLSSPIRELRKKYESL